MCNKFSAIECKNAKKKKKKKKSYNVKKRTFWHVCQAKIQISLRIF